MQDGRSITTSQGQKKGEREALRSPPSWKKQYSVWETSREGRRDKCIPRKVAEKNWEADYDT